VECVFESFMVGPDFAHGRLSKIQSDGNRVEVGEWYLAFVVKNDSGKMLVE